jgi:hypothetical protein
MHLKKQKEKSEKLKLGFHNWTAVHRIGEGGCESNLCVMELEIAVSVTMRYILLFDYLIGSVYCCCPTLSSYHFLGMGENDNFSFFLIFFYCFYICLHAYTLFGLPPPSSRLHPLWQDLFCPLVL